MSASFTYPPGGNYSLVATNGYINIYDKLSLEYTSTWDSLNLTLFCAQSATSSSVFYDNVVGNPVLGQGTYSFGTIESANFDIHQYPVNCFFKLTQHGNNDNQISGERFRVTSIVGTSTTYEEAGSTTTTVPQSTGSPSVVTNATSSYFGATSTGATNGGSTAASSVPTSDTISVSQASGGLSTGAKAGIGVGIAVGAVLILVFCFLLFRRKSKGRSRSSEPSSHNLLTEKAATSDGNNAFQNKPAFERQYAQELDAQNISELGTSR